MGTLMRTIVVSLASVSPAFAASGSELSENSFPSVLILLFIGFNALIIIPNFIAGLIAVAQKLIGFKVSQLPKPRG